jgi:hypothetical protein
MNSSGSSVCVYIYTNLCKQINEHKERDYIYYTYSIIKLIKHEVVVGARHDDCASQQLVVVDK